MNLALACPDPPIRVIDEGLEIPAPDQKPEDVVGIGELPCSPRSDESIEKSRWRRHLASLPCRDRNAAPAQETLPVGSIRHGHAIRQQPPGFQRAPVEGCEEAGLYVRSRGLASVAIGSRL